MRFRKTIMVLLASATQWAVAAEGQAASGVEACAATLQFDTTTFNQNYLAQISVLNMVNQSNYEQVKQNFGASLLDFFSGNFENFQTKRSELNQVMSSDQTYRLNTNYYQRVLSPAGAEAYSKCVASLTNAPMIAYVSSGQRSEFVAVTVRNNLVGTSRMKIMIVTPDYIQRMNEPTVLLPGSQQTILFRSPLDKTFVAVINGEDAVTGGGFAPATIEMPPYVEFRRVDSFRDYVASGRCGAGGNGSTAGSPLREAVYFSADANYALMPETVSLKSKTLEGGPGLATDPVWKWVSSPANSNRPSGVRGDPGSCEGSSGHTQSIVRYTFGMRGISSKVVRVNP